MATQQLEQSTQLPKLEPPLRSLGLAVVSNDDCRDRRDPLRFHISPFCPRCRSLGVVPERIENYCSNDLYFSDGCAEVALQFRCCECDQRSQLYFTTNECGRTSVGYTLVDEADMLRQLENVRRDGGGLTYGGTKRATRRGHALVISGSMPNGSMICRSVAEASRMLRIEYHDLYHALRRGAGCCVINGYAIRYENLL